MTALDIETTSRFVHRKALGEEGEHDYSIDIANDSNPNYLRWVADLCAPFLGQRLLDVGAGFGAVTQHLVAKRDVVLLDSSEACWMAMNDRFRDMENVEVIHGDLRELSMNQVFDSIMMINVLEHIYDDAGILALLRSHLVPGGNVVLYVPALNGYFTAWDRKVGHYRRYSKRRLLGVVAEAGLILRHLEYVNLLGLSSWPFSGQMLKSGDSAAGPLSLWDRYATPLSRAIEQRVRIPIGLNLLCVAQAPG
jgi:2-polyprenyl-3-methyl-5-hydroxy-6-metoxy-1,4-benzoquinol methylase